jgi:N-carbamoyl-L-amino-acid hydrolase
MSAQPFTVREQALAQSLFRELFAQLSAIGANAEGGATRLTWTAEAEEAARWFDSTAAGLGFATSVDRNGNRWAGANEPAAIVTGSHLDTVARGGRFDGALGVVSGLIALHLVNSRGPTERPLAVVAFADERADASTRRCLAAGSRSARLTRAQSSIAVTRRA